MEWVTKSDANDRPSKQAPNDFLDLLNLLIQIKS